MDFTGITTKLDTLAEMCCSLHDTGEAVGWHAEIKAEWERACAAYKATKEAVKLLGYELDRTDNGDGTYTHTITKEET